MEKYIKVQKKLSETPGELISRVRLEFPELTNAKLAYAGRLDPMASGEMIILIGDECANREFYQSLDKIYEYEILIGIATDSLDILGLIENISSIDQIQSIDATKIAQGSEKITNLKYPVFSSKTIDGVPMWQLYKSGRLDLAKIPNREVIIYQTELLSDNNIELGDIKKEITTRIQNLRGNFRQLEIIAGWQDIDSNMELRLIKLRSKVSSGTYIRSLAVEICRPVNVLCYSINRVEVIL